MNNGEITISRSFLSGGKSGLKFIVGGVLTLLLVIGGVISFQHMANVWAATTYDIAGVGNISSLTVLDKDDVEYSDTNLAPFARNLGSRFVIQGSIISVETLSQGDQVTISLKNTPDSTYRIAGSSQQFDATLSDGGGTPQFSVAYNSTTGVITLTKNANTASGVFNFSLTSSNAPTRFNSLNTSSTFYVDGFLSAGFTFPNAPKTETLNNWLCVTSGGMSRLNASTLHLSIIIGQIYNSLLAGQNIETVYGSMLDQDVIVFGQIEANNQIVSINYDSSVAYLYDLMSSGTALNSGFLETLNTAVSLNKKVNISPDSSPTQVQSALEAAGAGYYVVVKNSDNSWTTAVNMGKILGNDVASYREASATVISQMPNTPVINAKNLQLVQDAISMKLMAERPAAVFMVRFADPEQQDSYTLNMNTNINACTFSRTYPDSSATNALVGQTTVKVHYVDRAGNPVEEVVNSYGFPAGSTYGTPNAPVGVSPKTITGYSLVTNSTDLSDFATAQGISPSDVLSADSSIPFPSYSALSPNKTEVYYVYNQLYTVSFENNQADTANPGDQDVVEQDTAAKPADPGKDGYTFEYWYVCSGNENDPFDFGAPVTSNIQLCAKWLANEQPGSGGAPGAPNTGVSGLNSLWFTWGLGLGLSLVVAGVVATKRLFKNR
ncbi:MAG: InlB B-repeat-containing protein [Candidatus Nomurabacteria bacterium]|jgi:hypothetical protein|nr:InlB B-repeat-containing protein [Candidatus Nomurabacteria bacterium]